jgi:hypothetical protein
MLLQSANGFSFRQDDDNDNNLIKKHATMPGNL